MDELAARRYVPPFDFALVHLGLGASPTMFSWLEQAHKARSYELVSLKVDPRFDAVRSELRFGKLLKRMGFETLFGVAV